MAEIKEFIINDRRKFTAEGDIRPDAPPAPSPSPSAPKLFSSRSPNPPRTSCSDTPIPHELHGPPPVPTPAN